MDHQQDALGRRTEGFRHGGSIGSPRAPNRAATLFKNTLAQSGTTLLGYLLSFILAPILIARLGLSAFGVWAVTGAFAAYAGLFDFGVGRSLQRFIALYDAQDNSRAIRECVTLGLIVVTAVGALAVGAAVIGAPLLSDQLGVLDHHEMRLVLLSSVGIWIFSSYAYVLDSVGIGLRRMLPPNVAAMSAVTVNFVFSIGAVIASSDLVVYAVANAAAALVGIVPAAIALAYVWRRPLPALPSRALTREVLTFGIKDQVGHLAHLINFQTDKTVIALLVDVRAAAAFEVAGRIVMAVQSIAMLATSAMLPTLTVEIAQRGREVVAGLYRRYTRLSSGLAFPIFAVTAITAPFLLMAWVGDIPGDGDLVVSFLILAYGVHITTGVASTVVIGMGDPGMVAANSILMAALNVALTVALAPLFDFWGVVTGTFLALSIGSLVFIARFHRRFSLHWSDYLGAVGGPAALAFGLAVPFVVLDLFLGEPSSRVEAAGALVVIAGVYGLAYWIAATRLGYLPSRLAFPLGRRRGAMAAAQS